MMSLDPRLSLALSMYDRCALAADIGTDHAYLPAALLLSGRCDRMIITDKSLSALEHARSTIAACGLEDRVSVILGDGLEPLDTRCSMISIMGMGGRNISGILRRGSAHLCGAALLLSCHSDLPELRRGIMEAGYHITAEEPCLSSGRYYLILRAEKGCQKLSDIQLRTGVKLLCSRSPELKGYLARRREIIIKAVSGARKAVDPSYTCASELGSELDFYDAALAKLP